VAHYSFKSFDTIICACMVWHITVLKASIQLFVPVWCGTLQILKFDRIICTCMV
jgi:regulatory protein YycI of two-component signal transduction system YycFG